MQGRTPCRHPQEKVGFQTHPLRWIPWTPESSLKSVNSTPAESTRRAPRQVLRQRAGQHVAKDLDDLFRAFGNSKGGGIDLFQSMLMLRPVQNDQ